MVKLKPMPRNYVMVYDDGDGDGGDDGDAGDSSSSSMSSLKPKARWVDCGEIWV